MTLAAITIFIFRRKLAHIERKVKVPLFPIVPLIYIVLSTAFVFVMLKEVQGPSWWGMVVLALGIPVYYFFKKYKK